MDHRKRLKADGLPLLTLPILAPSLLSTPCIDISGRTRDCLCMHPPHPHSPMETLDEHGSDVEESSPSGITFAAQRASRRKHSLPTHLSVPVSMMSRETDRQRSTSSPNVLAHLRPEEQPKAGGLRLLWNRISSVFFKRSKGDPLGQENQGSAVNPPREHATPRSLRMQDTQKACYNDISLSYHDMSGWGPDEMVVDGFKDQSDASHTLPSSFPSTSPDLPRESKEPSVPCTTRASMDHRSSKVGISISPDPASRTHQCHRPLLPHLVPLSQERSRASMKQVAETFLGNQDALRTKASEPTLVSPTLTRESTKVVRATKSSLYIPQSPPVIWTFPSIKSPGPTVITPIHF
ncbi:MAG: hypothetical protein DHS80DRAFT_33209 [Piptocephalis tieghemiana]|nr:MAG: hypothetical protein DHS80DRAFT_33209 [Piptocephalis tieghemiana]